MKVFTRLCVLVVALNACYPAFAQVGDCSGPQVSLNELAISLDHEITDVQSNIYLAVSGMDIRGIIDPESGSGWLCDNDYGLVVAWLGIPRENSSGVIRRTEEQALEIANGGLIPVILLDICADSDVDLLCDPMGVAIGPQSIRTNAKLGVLPLQAGALLAAMTVWGAFIEPHTLDPGQYLATATVPFDIDCLPLANVDNPVGGQCDGIADDEIQLTGSFEVFAAPTGNDDDDDDSDSG